MAPEQQSAHWDEIVGPNWPAIGPAEWSALEAAAREASRVMNTDDAARARLDFDERVRSSGRLQSVKDRMLAQRNDPQAYSDALAATADVLRSYSDVVYRTRNQILDIVERADRDIRAEQRAAAAEAEDDEDDEAEADRAAERAERIAAVIARARADVDDIAAAALNSISPVSLPELTAIADHLGQPGPLAPNRPVAPEPPPPTDTPSADTDPDADTPSAPDTAGPPGEPRNPYGRVPHAAFPLQPAGWDEPDSRAPNGDDARADEDAAERPEGREPSGQPAERVGGPQAFDPKPGAPPVGPWHDPSVDTGTGGPTGAGMGRTAPAVTEPDNDETTSDTEDSAVGRAGERASGSEDGTTGSGDVGGTDRSGDVGDTEGAGDTGGEGAADIGGDGSALGLDVAPSGGTGWADGPVAPGQVLPPAVVTAPPPMPTVASQSTAATAGAASTAAAAASANATAAARSPSGVFGPSSAVPQSTSSGAPPQRADARPDRPSSPLGRDDTAAERDEPQRAEEVVGAAMVAAAAPSFLVGERVDGDLVLARTLLAGVLAAVGPTVLGLDWAVVTMRGPAGLSAFLTSNEGRGWLPTGLFLPEVVSMPWLWSESERAGAAWEGIADPARVLVEFGLAWGQRSAAGFTALASSTTIGPDLRARFRELPMADSVPASARWDLRAPAPGLVDRLGAVGARELSARADAIPGGETVARCAGLAWDAHSKVAAHAAPGPEAAMTREVRERILAMVRRDEPVPPELWDELRDADDLLTAAMLTRRIDASRVDLGELKTGPDSALLRAMVFERRCDELVLLLAETGASSRGPVAAQLMRDAVYAHAQILGHPQFVPEAPAGPADPGGGRPVVTAPRR
ncbi:hypothetical protein IU474_31565 [Nocardia otitidiscaviarum]|uniref:hypothetical protein n=1 Tax=Nocardia otitidiscaviarum TaxID=1823 RepID=UPI00189358A9|nr:hypothetical protein [Nocardia otitidiscaviarum]MBF6241584.1 hypothetical protein [Nocardia otitidiscaviarum]